MATNSKMLMPAILSISLLTVMASTAVSPALSSIKEAFPDISNTSAKMVLTLPSLVMIPFSLLSGWFSTRMNKKWLVLLGMALYILFGVGGGFVQSFTQLIIVRALFGIAIGILMPLSNTLIFDLVDESKRSKMMGLAGSSNQLGGMLFLSVSGVLTGFSWRYSFGVYALALLSIVMILIWLPSMPPVKQQTSSSRGKGSAMLNWKIFALAFLAMMSSVAFFVVNTDLALYIQQEKTVFSSTVALVPDKETLMEAVQQGQVNDQLVESFNRNGVKISSDAVIKETQPGREWIIQDTQKEYRVAKEKDGLHIYSPLGTSEMAGYALSLMGLPAVIAGFILSFLLKRIGNYLMPAAALIMAVGYYTLGLADSYTMILVAVLFIGLAGGLLSPPMLLLIPKIVSSSARALGIAVMSSSILLGQFVSPLYTQAIALIFGNETFRFRFFMITVTLIVFAVLGTCFILVKSRIQGRTLNK